MVAALKAPGGHKYNSKSTIEGKIKSGTNLHLTEVCLTKRNTDD